MQTTDFTRSHLRFRVDSLIQAPVTVTHVAPTTLNNVRINVECRCEIIERSTGTSRVFALGASCKTERVGAQHDCWLEPNADFCLAASEQEFLILKSWARIGLTGAKRPGAPAEPKERQSGASREVFVDLRVHLKSCRGHALTSLDDIIRVSQGDRQIISHTEYDQGDYRVVLDHPVKTINYSERESVFQTDTGPVLLPDLSTERLRRCDRLIDCFDLAYSAFNSAGWAEFIVKVPTSVGDGVLVDHYSMPRRIEPVCNQLIEVLDEVRHQPHTAVGERLIRTDSAKAGVG